MQGGFSPNTAITVLLRLIQGQNSSSIGKASAFMNFYAGAIKNPRQGCPGGGFGRFLPDVAIAG
jgi:hypothetical protein